MGAAQSLCLALAKGFADGNERGAERGLGWRWGCTAVGIKDNAWCWGCGAGRGARCSQPGRGERGCGRLSGSAAT